MTEIWKDITWYEWKYQVSDLWNVRSTNYHRQWIIKNLKQWISTWWYLYATLCKNSKVKNFKTHRLVWQAFLWLDIQDKSICVCHRNDIPSDNRLENLFLWTFKENTHDMMKKGRSGAKWKIGSLHSQAKSVSQYTSTGKFIKKWWSIIEAERELSIFTTVIIRSCKWKQELAWWYKWKYT